MSAQPAGVTGEGPAGPLISAPDLAARLRSADPPAVLDVRWRLGGPPGIDGYLAGHVPGAVYLDLDTELAGSPGYGGRHPLPDPAAFETAMRAAGLSRGRAAVVYDEADSTIAARLWWMLRFYGHDQVQVLDGGLRAWESAGLPVTTEPPAPAAGDFATRPGQLPVLTAEAAADLARSGILLDARAPARYRGETEPVDRVAGHIPGALSAPTAENVTGDGRFRPVSELRARFASLGIDGQAACGETGGGETGQAQPGQVGVYCGSGVTAAHEILALALAGIDAALYVGSWSGWVADPARPVATGPQPG